MGGNLLNIGKTGLYAAQAGLATTGHNIANASTPGYSRQNVVQSSSTAQDFGYGFVGSGTQISEIKRFSDEFLNTQVRTAQASSSALDAYGAAATQVDNLLADTDTGMSPALQDFFKSVQNVSANAGSTPSRQAMLSNAQTLATRFQGLNGQLAEIRSRTDGQIESDVVSINSYAKQIAGLNDQIAKLSTGTGNAPNDLLDQRDQLVLELNKQVKATVVAGENNTVTVSIGAGQPLVVGAKSFELATVPSPTDPSRVAVGYRNGNSVNLLPESALTGGELGGLLEFRSGMLDAAQNGLGRLALTIAASFNAQNHLGQDSTGKMGGDLFAPAAPVAGVNGNRFAPDPANPSQVTATLATPFQPGALTTSDYMVSYDAASARFNVTRLADQKVTALPAYSQPGPQSANIDGLAFTISGQQVDGDSFLVRPTAAAAKQFSVVATSVAQIAAAGPVMTGAATGNRGSAVVSEGKVDTNFSAAAFTPATLTYNAASNELTGFASGQWVTVTTPTGTTGYLAGTDTVPFTEGATYTFGGVSLSLSGKPIDQDKFTVARTSGGVSDNRNMLAMGTLQSQRLLDGGASTLQDAFAQIVSTVGNKTREVQVNGQAGATMLAQASTVQQSVSGVNLDEEAANLLKYQQAYQAAGKVMQIASTLFDTILSIGH
jgi:flagellar hook-associated protein 1 FlgK